MKKAAGDCLKNADDCLPNKERGSGKLAAAYVTSGCPSGGDWGSGVLIFLVLVVGGYVGGGSVVGSRAKGSGVGVRNHPHWQRWQELRGLCADGVTFARSGGSRRQALGRSQSLLAEGRKGGGGRTDEVKERREKAPKSKSTKSTGSEKKRSGKSESGKSESPRSQSSAAGELSPAVVEEAASGTAAGGGGRWVHVPT